MSIKIKNSTVVPLIVSISFIAMGIICMIVFSISDFQDDAFMSKAQSCNAQVTNISTYTTRSRTGTGKHRRYRTVTHYNAYVSYNVNGVNYNNIKISDVSSSTKKGDTLIVYYDPQNPSDARLKSDTSVRWIPYTVSSLFIIVGVFVLIVYIREKRRNSQPQISAQNNINSTSTTYNAYYNDNEPQNYSDNQNIYNTNSDQAYNDYSSNSFDTYNSYPQNDNSNNFNTQQSSPFNNYNSYSQNDNSNNLNTQQSSPFNNYNSYSQNDNSNNFNSQQSSPFNNYNSYSQNDNSNNFNSQQSSPFNTYNGNQQNDNSKPKSPFERYK